MNPLLFVTTISFLYVLVQGNNKEALVFDRYNLSLFDLPDRISQNAKCGAWAVACPAESAEENDFINEYSFTNNALFVREIHHRGSKASEVKKDVCKESFKLSLTFHIRSSTFQFGFEFYYKLSDAQYFHQHDFADYKSIEETVPNLASAVSKGIFVVSEYKRMAQNAFGTNIEELWFNKDYKMGFIWVTLVKFVFDSPNRIVRKMMYHISTNSKWPVENERCENFSLGKEVYRGIEVDQLYSQTKPNNIINQLKLPWKTTEQCTSNDQCFKKILLIPMDQFSFGSSSPLCSDLATIPIWTKTATELALKKVDQFLYAIHKARQEPLHIIAGLFDVHKYSKKRGMGKSSIYLDSDKKKIPIPKVIFKMVEYRVKNCKLEEKLCWYSAIIVIHNDPFFKSSEKICSVVTKDWGWEEMVADENTKISEIVYVCPRDRNIVSKLFGLKKAYTGPAVFPNLNLIKFPYSKDGKEITETDIVKNVRDTLADLSKGKDISTPGSGRIMELPADIVNPNDAGLLSDDGEGVGQTEEGSGNNVSGALEKQVSSKEGGSEAEAK